MTAMNTTYSNLSYEFYYLLRTEIEKAGQLVREPRPLSAVTAPRLSQEGLPIDQDKRLFRYQSFIEQAENDLTDESPQSVPLDEWPQHLQKGWDNIQRHYIEYFAKQGIEATQAQAFCSDALLGVALLINDAQLESHRITMPLRSPGDRAVSQVAFIPDTWLLYVDHTPPEDSPFERMPEPAILARFEAQFQHIQQDKHWQLLLDLPIPQLAPMEIAANTNHPAQNPIFAVYGVAHGDVMPDTDEEDWPHQLPDFLVGQGPALLVRLLPRLLVREWQFIRMDFAARKVRKYLSASSHLHHQAQLACLSNQELVDGLQAMAELRADTTLLLGQLQQAIETLEIHHHHSERRLLRTQMASEQWKVIWQHGGEAPLLDSFRASQQKLHHHISCIEGELSYLDGIRQKWRLQFEAQQLASSERLGGLGILLALLVAVGTASLMAVGFSYQVSNHQDSFLSPLLQVVKEVQQEPWIVDLFRLLSQPLVYGLLIILLLLPLGWFIGKAGFRKVRCKIRRLFGF